MNEAFEQLEAIIATRRTTKPDKMNGEKISDEIIKNILKLANWAPNHGNTEPWQFRVYSGEAVKQFCADHAELYKTNTPATTFENAKFEKLRTAGDLASHIVIGIMQRGNLPKIPVLEELAAVACAMQNLLLGAHAQGIASYWGSGGMLLSPVMKEYLQLRHEDQIMGALYFGYTNKHTAGFRNHSIEEKTIWMR